MFEVRPDDLITLPAFKFYHLVETILLKINGTAHMLKFKHLYKHLHESGCYSAHSHNFFDNAWKKTAYFLCWHFYCKCCAAASFWRAILMLLWILISSRVLAGLLFCVLSPLLLLIKWDCTVDCICDFRKPLFLWVAQCFHVFAGLFFFVSLFLVLVDLMDLEHTAPWGKRACCSRIGA